ncbi:carboxymuconolactone decarboxylase family protein [Microbacterium trichothecenolyticum]|uniref:carboxymuconolactone decarboxylase family protein n=1 Tax=Microbacterium trichothecenolyticum TaxID=69370 RepID=UPI001C6E7738|nr:carboxymuconolactone decarboxylase family protein [Microbacterium trichothecenolyticum]MBW9120945.1 carboxymuconolactone decarboxylase family protein [Microbacterium trichothecenolyticum]
MIVTTPDLDGATGHVAEMYDGDLSGDGFVFGHTRAMAVNPEAHQAFEALIRAIVPSIGLRNYELATLGAARAIGSDHCLLAHGRKSLRAGILDEDQLVRLAREGAAADLDEKDMAVIAYSERLSTDAATMTDADTRRLRDLGFTDRQIVDLTLAAAVRNYFSRALLALAVPVDDVPGLSPAVVAALLAPAQAARGDVSGG